MHLFERNERADSLLEIVRDVQAVNDHNFQFTNGGRYLILGNAGGTLTVCDLIEVNRRLSELKMGW
jgi:hypothetical protein